MCRDIGIIMRVGVTEVCMLYSSGGLQTLKIRVVLDSRWAENT